MDHAQTIGIAISEKNLKTGSEIARLLDIRT